MSLADVSQVFDTINQQQARQQQASQFQQQQKLAQQQQALEEKRLQLQHEHEQATLAALQAYQRTQQFNTLAQNPAEVRAVGTLVNQNYSQPMTEGPTIALANQQPTSETYQVPSQVPGEQPFQITQPTRTQEATLEGQEAGLKNKPLYEQQQQLERQRAEAEQNAATIRAYLDHEHDLQKAQLERESAERIAAANNAARMNEERLRSGTEFGVEKLRQQGLYDPNRVSQAVQDLYNGNTTMEDFNRSPLSKYEKENAQSGLAAAGAHPISKVQSDYINAVTNLKDLLPEVRDFIANQPNVSTFGLRQVAGQINKMGSEQDRRYQEIESGFGQLSKAIQSGVSSGRIPIFEAQKIMGLLPDPHLPADQNIQKYNQLVKELGSHINTSLSNITPAQRQSILQNRGLDTSEFKTYVDQAHLKQGIAQGTTHFKIGNDDYDIPNEKVAAFVKKHPEATKQ